MDVVRQAIAVRVRHRRSLLERLALRIPRLMALVQRVVLRLPPGSRLRRAAVRHWLRLAVEAANRADYEAAFALIVAPDYEVITPPELAGLGFDPAYHGRDGRLRFQHAWVSELGEFQQEAEEVIDCGNRLLLLGRMRGSGLGSGATFDSEVAYLLTISGGLVVREHNFRSHAEAFEAAGLRG
jgi:SnoaL-like domain